MRARGAAPIEETGLVALTLEIVGGAVGEMRRGRTLSRRVSHEGNDVGGTECQHGLDALDHVGRADFAKQMREVPRAQQAIGL